ncbi:MAG TPA: radical SAM protein [Spirochaetota bacterium]|nr:radical SAM protein [Spirochaetota bacterium]
MKSLVVNEIFRSIQGESLYAGFPSLFIRLTGCNLNCTYCDTQYAKDAGKEMTYDEILEIVTNSSPFHHITMTGGEPLLQEHAAGLLELLKEKRYLVQVETNGSISLENVPSCVRKIVDVKTPSSGEEGSFLMENLKFIEKGDEIKFVISDQDDYNYSKKFLEKYGDAFDAETTVNFSPVLSRMPAGMLGEQIISDRLVVRLHVQLHALLWPEGEKKSR